MNTVVGECVNPNKGQCRGCKYSYRPEFYDGGCKLHYEKETEPDND